MKKIFLTIRNNYDQLLRISLFLITLFIIVYLFPRQGKFRYEFTKGKPWMHETIIAPFDFSILKSEEALNKEKKIVKKQHLPIFNYNHEMFDIVAEGFVKQFEEKWSINNNVKKDDKFTLFDLLNQKRSRSKTKKYNLVEFGYNTLTKIYDKGLIQLHADLSYDSDQRILLKRGSLAEKKFINDFYTIKSAANSINLITDLSEEEYNFLVPLLLSSLEYNISYDKIASETLLINELASISTTQGLIIVGQTIINKGELVDADNYQKLLSIKKIYEGKKWNIKSYYLVLFGQVLLVGISLFILFLFVKQNRIELLNSPTKISMILSLILLMVVASSITIAIDVSFLYIIPFCITPIILKAFFDTRVALFTHLILVLIVGFIVPNGFEFVFLQLIAGIVSILTVLKMYKRAQLFVSVGKIIGVYVLIHIALSVTHEGSFSGIDLKEIFLFTISGALTLLAYPLIFAFEKIFRVVSDISLLELTDTNNPLLRRLSDEAPGTFQHSLQVANLAEDVVLEIGGNALLTRAGAIYHDIGKLKNPLYFIENQSININPHDSIESHESASLIINHVIDGVQIAKDNNLPDEIIGFIRTHHGTTTVQYFYKKCIANSSEEDIDISNFKYSGPKPYSKETAVLMMADASEASARSLKNPTKDEIDNLIEKVINKQIDQQQFTDSDITFKEITIIKEIFKKKLANIHHARVEY